ncbi:MAG: DNA-binding response OmpR family regulator [Myxococcota bacterium]|jgi:DNA-binding response OmpR family regulator
MSHEPPRYILIVQEDERQREEMRNALTPEYEVKCIGDGLDALSEVINRKPDLLIVDLVLPGIPGLEVVHALQSTRQNIPILTTVGGDRRSEDWLRASIMGAAKLMRRPISPEELRKWVRTVLNEESAPRRTPEADDAAALLLDHGKPKVSSEDEFGRLLDRAHNMDCKYDQQSILLLMQARSYLQRDQLTRVAEGVLRSGDYMVPYREEMLIVLLPLTRLACAGSIVERVGKEAEEKRIPLAQLRCSAIGVAQALDHDDWNSLFGTLVPWIEFVQAAARK